MLKKLALAAVIIMASLGLTAAPANANPAGVVTFFPEANFQGVPQPVINPTTACTQIAPGFSAKSLVNDSTAIIALYKLAPGDITCDTGERTGFLVAPGMVDNNITPNAATHFRAEQPN